jgi:hypothetical protein
VAVKEERGRTRLLTVPMVQNASIWSKVTTEQVGACYFSSEAKSINQRRKRHGQPINELFHML